jgi:hypothetical protein
MERLLDSVARNSLLIVALATLAAALLSLAPQLLVADSWMTLVAGREIVAHGLPSTESLTVMPAGRDWVDQQWLAQLVFYGTERLGGMRLALFLDVVLVVLAFGSATAASLARGASARSTLYCMAAAMIVAPWAWQLRAQSFALPLFTSVLGLLATDPRFERRRTWLVFPLLVVWANLHGSVILGAAIACLAGLIGVLNAATGRPAPSWTRSAALVVLPWLCLVTSPYALELPGYYRLLLVDSPVSKVISEWQAPEPSGWRIAFFVLAGATVIGAVWKWRALRLFDLGVLGVTLAGSLRSTRGIVWFVLAVAILLPVALDALLGPDRSLVRRRLGVGLAACFAGLAVVAVVGTTATRPASWFVQEWPGDRATSVIAAGTRDAGRMAVWPSDKHADWLLWRLPQLRGRVAYDVRFELPSSRDIESIVRYKGLRPGWERPLDGYRLVVVDPEDTPEHRRRLVRRGAGVLYANDTMVVLSTPFR